MADGTLKVGTITTSSGSGTITLGQSGETITVPSGATLTVPSGGLSGQNYPAFSAYPSGATLTVPSGGLSGQNYPAFSAYRGSSQSISNQTYTRVSFDYEFYDTDNAYDSTTNYKFTVPSGKAGKYHFDAMVRFSAFTGEVRLVPFKNGGDYGFQSTYIGNITTTVTSSFDLDLSAGDFIEIYCWQNSGGSLNLSADTLDPILTTFSGFRIGA